MKNIIKSWGLILLGFGFLKVFDIFGLILDELKIQLTYKIMCLIAASISFTLSIIENKNSEVKLHKGIIRLFYLMIAIISLIIILAIIGYYV